MHDETGDELRPLPQRVQSFAIEPYAGSFEPRSDLSYRLIEGLTLHGRSVHLSSFSGAILRGCIFVEVDFSRSDLDGARIENCRFERCDLSRIDLRSSLVTGTSFNESVLEGADLLDSTFLDTSFHHTSFVRTSTHGTHFDRCAFIACSLSGASWTLCNLRQTSFTAMVLGDCTFIYNVVQGCIFTSCSAEIECIGMIYGLTQANLAALRLLHGGEEQEVPKDADLSTLLTELYEQKRWGMGVMVMRLNFLLSSRVYAIREYFRWLHQGLISGMVVRTEEIDFLGMVFRDLRSTKALPLLNVIECIDLLNGPIASSMAHLSDTRSYALIGRFAGSLQGLLVEMLNEFESHRIRYREDAPLLVRAKFEKRPTSALSELLRAAGDASGLPVAHDSVTLETFAGSFVEIAKTSITAVLALQIVLYLLNGCVIQATELRERVRRLLSKSVPPEYRQAALQRRQQLPPRIAESFQSLVEFANRLPWFGKADLGGFSTENFRELQRIRVPARHGYGDHA